MKKVSILFIAICSFAFSAFAIGQQHGLFRSQSTQGTAWQGTATIIEEHYDITVYPDYLDVELDWVFKASGTAPAEHRDALEIVGNLNLVGNSVVVGMITWYKDMILKGKLKTNDVARQQYETVVERDSKAPPPPRDPVLLEYIRDDNYDISIFPVEFGKTRKVRIRYLIPAFDDKGINRIAYPHAFTDSATVSIQLGAGVKGYTIQSATNSIIIDKIEPVTLDRAVYQFQAYGGVQGKKRIDYIVPQLSNTPDGSVIYAGEFSAESMSGEMSHVITMTADKVLMKTSVAMDYVILWRWTHPQVLARYAGQIVGQSKLLIKFLESLNAQNKRAAMIVDMQGGERVTFHLDKHGSTEYKRMIKWLEEIGAQQVKEPVRTTISQPEIAFDMQQSLKEFNTALEAAIALFQSDVASFKHLILLTAGPRLVNRQIETALNVTLDSSVNVSKLSSCMQSQDLTSENTSLADEMYWPGVDLGTFFQKFGQKFRVTATVGNGDKSYTFETSPKQQPNCSYCGTQTTTEAHLFSNKPLKKEIIWNVMQGDKLLTEYVETPTVVTLSDGMQYGRLIGASKYLNPLANQMPSSVASALGFIDKKYSLVALEEDALPADLVNKYNASGVPLLDRKDIFAASDEQSDMAVDKWLIANPPASLSKSSYSNYYVIGGGWALDGGIRMFAFDSAAEKTVNVQPEIVVDENIPVRIAVAPAQVMSYITEVLAYDYSDALSIRPIALRELTDRISFSMNKGALVIDFSSLTENELQGLTITIYDLKGRIVKVLNAVAIGSNRQLRLSPEHLGISRGAYFMHVKGMNTKIAQRIVLR